MRKGLLVVVALCLVTATTACWGPNQVSRWVDDWTNQVYVDSPWLAQLLYYIPVFGIATVVAGVADIVVTNPIDFWGKSAFRGKGTGFEHKAVQGAPEVVK